jgi:hypothetical protein
MCISPVYSPSSPVVFFVSAVFEGTLFAFTLYHAVRDFRNGVLSDHPNVRFLAVLYRDGFYYFAAVVAVQGWSSLEVSTYITFLSFLPFEICPSYFLPTVCHVAYERHVHGCLLHMGGDDSDEQ